MPHDKGRQTSDKVYQAVRQAVSRLRGKRLMERIVVRINAVELEMTPRDTPTARAILRELPQQAVAQTWGEEVYFHVPVSAALEADARDVVDKGEIAFWTGGSAIAIGYGRTPVFARRRDSPCDRRQCLGRCRRRPG